MSRQTEVKRGGLQIVDAFGVIDLRDIMAIRRAFQIIPQPLHNETNIEGGQAGREGNNDAIQLERSASDDGDEGGAEGLAKSADKPTVKVKRSFELLLRTGHVVRFEVRSPDEPPLLTLIND